MKKLIVIIGGLILAFGAKAEKIHIATPSTSLVVNAEKGKTLEFLYYGKSLSNTDLASLESAQKALEAYPVYGLRAGIETAMSVTHSDGNMTLDPVVESVERRKDGEANLTTVKLADRYYPFGISLNYRTYPDCDVIETWVEAENQGEDSVELREFASAYLPVRRGDNYLTSFYGAWANEARMQEEALTHGIKTIMNKDGVRNSQTSHGEIMISLDGKPRENEGREIGAALCYSGNYKIRIHSDNSDYHHIFAGINEENSAYILDKGETFVTPPLAISYSEEGKSGISRNFHRWGRKHRLAHGNQLRPILLNSWEGVYFNINEKGMAEMMEAIASMGGELFVMDDGWFGTKYKRDNGTYALGDWTVDTDKLPGGLNGLLAEAKKNGIGFGIWIEPEMTNTKSKLYEEHPEYIIKASNREPVTGRGGTQVVLDLSNPEVQDLVFGIVDTLLTNYPDIKYIKWDANASVMNHGSQYLTADRQSHLYIDYHKGLASVLERIRNKYPDVLIQACASGGGRASWGVLPWFDEFWVSDNTDALQRIYMQWGISHFFPAMTMASHISAAPNHQTNRTIPIKFRTDVAMSGRLGMEIQPKNMSEKEKAQCKQAIEDYKGIREIVQLGDIYRLLSPEEGQGAASLMYVTPSKDRAVFFWWKTENFKNQQLPRIAMAGLEMDGEYKIHELNRIDKKTLSYEGKTFTGSYLMSNGLEMPLTHATSESPYPDYSSRVILIEKIK